MAQRSRFTRLRPGRRPGRPVTNPQPAANTFNDGYNDNNNSGYNSYNNTNTNTNSNYSSNTQNDPYNSYGTDNNYSNDNNYNNNTYDNTYDNNSYNTNTQDTSYTDTTYDNDGFLDTSQLNDNSGFNNNANTFDSFDNDFNQSASNPPKTKFSRPRPKPQRPQPNAANFQNIPNNNNVNAQNNNNFHNNFNNNNNNNSVQGSNMMGNSSNINNINNNFNNGMGGNINNDNGNLMGSIGSAISSVAGNQGLGAAAGMMGAASMFATANPEMQQMWQNFQATRNYPIWSLNYYKYYFRVDNKYVIYKLKSLMLPCLKRNVKDWSRKTKNNNSNGNLGFANGYEEAVNDVNAPDGYLPLMAVVTYIVIMGFVTGVTDASNQEQMFTPQVLISTASSAVGGLIFEVMLMKLGFYLIGTIAKPPLLLDLICYAGYKLLFVTLNLLIFLMIDSLIAYYIVSISTGILAATFMIQTMRPYFVVTSSNQSNSSINFSSMSMDSMSQSMNSIMQGKEPYKLKQLFLGGVGLWQVAFIQFMGRNMA